MGLFRKRRVPPALVVGELRQRDRLQLGDPRLPLRAVAEPERRQMRMDGAIQHLPFVDRQLALKEHLGLIEQKHRVFADAERVVHVDRHQRHRHLGPAQHLDAELPGQRRPGMARRLERRARPIARVPGRIADGVGDHDVIAALRRAAQLAQHAVRRRKAIDGAEILRQLGRRPQKRGLLRILIFEIAAADFQDAQPRDIERRLIGVGGGCKHGKFPKGAGGRRWPAGLRCSRDVLNSCGTRLA